MSRLISDAAKLTDVQAELGLTVDENSMSFDNIIKAIQVTQANMGIMGTTANEAATTIEGSVNTAKAAWTNLLTGIADDNADLDTLINNFVTSVETAASNILPRIVQILSGMGSTIQELAPIISEQLPILINSILPSLLSAGSQLLQGLLNGIVQSLPTILNTALQIISQLGNSIVSLLPQLGNSALQIITQLSNFLIESLPELIPSTVEIVLSIAEGLIDNIDLLVDSAIGLINALADGLIESLPILIEKAPEIVVKLVSAIIKSAPKIIEAGVELIGKLADGIADGFTSILSKIGSWIDDNILQPIKDKISDFTDIGKNLIEGFWNGIGDKVEWLKGKVEGVVDTIKGWFTGSDGFDTHSPSKWSGKIGKNIDEGLANEIDKNKILARRSMENVIKEISNAIPSLKSGIEYFNYQLSPAYATSGAYGSTTQNIVKTINNNTTSTMRIVADKQGIFDLVVDESNRRGKSLIEGRGL